MRVYNKQTKEDSRAIRYEGSLARYYCLYDQAPCSARPDLENYT